MATEGWGFKWTLAADADLSTKQFYAVGYTGTKFDIIATSGSQNVAGVLQNKPSANQGADAMLWGVTKWYAASAVTAGNLVAQTASGTCMVVASGTSGVYVKGQILRGCSASGVATVVLAAVPVVSGS